jgi:GDP/UDP-N,N'-diacetylbacillosamine 2-epimerase (hydrolysing)
MKRKVCVVTGTRAEYGLLYWAMKALRDDDDFQLQLCVTGMHLSPEFGLTYKNIESDGFRIDKKIEILMSSDTAVGISKSIGLGVSDFAVAFEELKPDIILILGDRFEMLSVAIAATIARIPIAHCHGGESTEGLIDEPIRHAITKMSHLHFTATKKYRDRVIQLGEQPENVFNVGALGIENINKLKLLNREDFQSSIGFPLAQRNVLVTFHPVTLEHATAEVQFNELLSALLKFEDTSIIFTKPNADTDGRVIIRLIDEFVRDHDNACSFISLGQLRYLSALQFMDAVIGNSSSGLIEVPSFKTATVNIGDRQRGRIQAASVISCEPLAHEIESALRKAFSPEFRELLTHVENPYGNTNSSETIVKVLKGVNPDGLVKKVFNDIV